jgi:hypothetical protein
MWQVDDPNEFLSYHFRISGTKVIPIRQTSNSDRLVNEISDITLDFDAFIDADKFKVRNSF